MTGEYRTPYNGDDELSITMLLEQAADWQAHEMDADRYGEDEDDE